MFIYLFNGTNRVGLFSCLFSDFYRKAFYQIVARFFILKFNPSSFTAEEIFHFGREESLANFNE